MEVVNGGVGRIGLRGCGVLFNGLVGLAGLVIGLGKLAHVGTVGWP